MRQQDNFSFEDGQLYKILEDNQGQAPYLNPEVRWDFMKTTHDYHGHFGYDGMLGVARTRGWWPRMQQDLRQYIQECPHCQVTQARTNKLGPRITQVDIKVQPFEKWAIDVVGPLPESLYGNRFIITAIDYATGWPAARPVPTYDAETTATFIYEEIYSSFGPPKELLSDNGSNFLSKVVDHLLKILKVVHKLSTPYHPRTNGKVENLNGTLGRVLTKMCLDRDLRLWDNLVPEALYLTRIRVHKDSRFSPFYLVFGVQPRILEDSDASGTIDSPEQRLPTLMHARQLANQRLLARAVAQGKIPNNVLGRTPEFPEGTWVLVRNENKTKLKAKWFGPYKVLKTHFLGTYALQTPQGRVLKHLQNGERLTKAHCSDAKQFWSLPQT